MEIKIIHENKKEYLDLLLLADEQESMIDKYIDNGTMFALFDPDLISICVVTDLQDGNGEIKNLATYENYQGMGYAAKLLNYIFDYYRGTYNALYVGTGDSPLTVPFYEKMGFEYSHKINNFFTENYDHLIIESGVQLVDMLYFKKSIK